MRFFARSLLVAALTVGMITAPAFAADEKPLGMIVMAESARLDSATAAMGASVYPGDALDTDVGGTLRLKFGTTQVYLLSSSAAELAQDARAAHVTVTRGTVGFSATPADPLELETPVGIIRAQNGQAAYGQVTITGSKEIVVSSYTGALVVERGGDTRTIEAGKSYDVSLEPNPVPAAAAAAQTGAGVTPAYNQHLLFKAVLLGSAAVVGYLLWQEESETCYKPCPCGNGQYPTTNKNPDGDCD